MATSCVYYCDQDGNEPVLDFIEKHFPAEPRGKASAKKVAKFAERRVRIDNYIDRMNDLDDAAPPLPFPHTSQIQGELRELRPQIGGVRYRILYQRSGNLFVLLHALVKNTGAVPQADIDLAKSRFDDFQSRMNANKRKPPRAAGSDAP